MKKSLSLLFLFVIIITLSCDNSKIRDELFQEVIEVHDTAMLKMQTIMTLKSKSIKEADSLRDLEDEALVDRIEELEKSQITLEEANKSMMIWMRAFRPPTDTVSHEQAMEYLRSEFDKISVVDSLMDQAVENAKAL